MPADYRTANGDAPRGRIVAGEVGVVGVIEATEAGTAECVRTPRIVRQSDPDLYGVVALDHGNSLVEMNGKQSRMEDGDFTLFHTSYPHWVTHAAMRHVVVKFPRAILPMRHDEVSRLVGERFPGDRGSGALISRFVRRLPRHLDDPEVTDDARLGTTVIDLLTVALASRLDRADAVPAETRQRALLPRIQAFIEERLGDRELSPGMIAAAHHISVRYLHRLFETQEATVSGWIRRRRLERSRRDLLDPALATRPIGATAARWGFGYAAHFNRAFRAAYGLPPGEYRAAYGSSNPN